MIQQNNHRHSGKGQVPYMNIKNTGRSTAETTNINELTIQIKLSINQSLFTQGYITEEIFTKAKNIIISSHGLLDMA